MSPLNSVCRTVLIALPLLTVAAGAVHAQPTNVPDAPALTPPAARPNQIRVRNLRSDIVAYWLDPANNPLPAMLARGARDGKTPVLPPPVPVKLPAGVERIVALPPMSLMVIGTPAATQQVQDLIAKLDRPLSQFEIETKLVSARRAQLGRLGVGDDVLDAVKEDRKRVFAIAQLPVNIQAQLTALVANGDAKILTAPRVTVLRDLTATLAANPAPTETPAVATGDLSTTEHGISFSSTASESEGAIILTLDVTGTEAPRAPGTGNVQSLSVDTNVHAVARLRDGGILALVNVPQALAGGRLAQDDDHVLVAFTTVRKIRRIGEDDVVPGAD